ncbi:heterokaryon incompatibility protein-domain-containing protein [Usnea florida]
MRLVNSSTLQLLDFSADKIPKYAILSHTWREDEDEVLFMDMEKGSAESKAGYQKLRYACKQAAAAGLEYIWIDTCCIDKSSSAELSEAINSMFSWYQRAEICYAYLADVSGEADIGTNNRWFKRGWTLQELIGSSNMVFFSSEWIELGTKSSLCRVLAEITGIDVGILTNAAPLESTSLAQRMSWASHRVTTRVEDIAYCLMGIFDINMPLLYGEGEKAFTRLQEEIMKNSDDHSLFAWTDPDAEDDDQYGLLAKEPRFFAHSGNIVPYREWEPSAPFSISNKGLRIELHLNNCGPSLYTVLHAPNPIPGLLRVQSQQDERPPVAVPKPSRKFKLPFMSPRA